MTTRTVGAWAAFVVAAGSLTGCTGAGGNSSYLRPNPAAAPKLTPPAATQPTAAAPANGSAWGRQQAQPATTRTQGDPSALAAPMGNTPQFTNQPTGGITPSGGIAPPAALPGTTAPPTPAAPASGTSTSNLLPTGPSINSLNAGTPVSAAPAPAPARQVAVNAVRTGEPPARVSVQPPAAPAPEDSPVAPPPMPPALSGSELPATPPQPITQLTPLPPVMLPTPTKVRQ
jgi:hypothetical protein